MSSCELASSSLTARSSHVILSEAKDLAAERDRPFASLMVTWGDGSNCHVRFVQIEPCLTVLIVVVPVQPLTTLPFTAQSGCEFPSSSVKFV